MLNRAGHHVGAASGRQGRSGDAEDCQIIALGSPGSEDQFAGIAVQCAGEHPPGPFEAPLCGLAIIVDAGGIPRNFRHRFQQAAHHLRRDRTRRVVVEVRVGHLTLVYRSRIS